MQLLVTAGQLTNRLLKNSAQLPQFIGTRGDVIQTFGGIDLIFDRHGGRGQLGKLLHIGKFNRHVVDQATQAVG